jgi:hypothetical protein
MKMGNLVPRKGTRSSGDRGKLFQQLCIERCQLEISLGCQLNEQRVIGRDARVESTCQGRLPYRPDRNGMYTQARGHIELAMSFIDRQCPGPNRHPDCIGELGLPMSRRPGFTHGLPKLPDFLDEWLRARFTSGGRRV